MNAREILDKIKGVFNSTEIITPVITKLQTSFPVDGQQPVYIEADALAVNIPAFLDPALTMPYPDGTYTVTGGQSFTVTAGLITAVGDPNAAAQQVTPIAPTIPPAVLPQMPPMFEQQFAAQKTEVETLKAELKAAQQTIAKHQQILPNLFALVEKLTEIPITEPKTLNDRQQAAFNRSKTREERLESISKNIQKLKSK